MKDTIQAKEAYRIVKVRNIITGEEGWRVDDGYIPLFVAQKRSYGDYHTEKRNNECFRQCEIFTTAKGNQFIYWRDEEIDADYITAVPNTKRSVLTSTK